MEERPVPPLGRATDDPSLLSAPYPESQETYVVQVPRDQVYRFPPPENARIVEHYTRNSPQKNKNNCCSGSLCWIIATITLVTAILIASIMLVRATLYSPKSPEFILTQIKAKNMNQILRYNTKTSTHPPMYEISLHAKNPNPHPPMYEISLHAKNPNPRLLVSYHGPGKASLNFQNHKIGQGGLPSMMIREESNTPVNILVTLSGKGMPLSLALKLSLIHKTEKIMNLKIQVPMEVNSWLRNGVMGLTITCDFGVANSLMNHTKISFQECDAQF